MESLSAKKQELSAAYKGLVRIKQQLSFAQSDSYLYGPILQTDEPNITASMENARQNTKDRPHDPQRQSPSYDRHYEPHHPHAGRADIAPDDDIPL